MPSCAWTMTSTRGPVSRRSRRRTTPKRAASSGASTSSFRSCPTSKSRTFACWSIAIRIARNHAKTRISSGWSTSQSCHYHPASLRKSGSHWQRQNDPRAARSGWRHAINYSKYCPWSCTNHLPNTSRIIIFGKRQKLKLNNLNIN